MTGSPGRMNPTWSVVTCTIASIWSRTGINVMTVVPCETTDPTERFGATVRTMQSSGATQRTSS